MVILLTFSLVLLGLGLTLLVMAFTGRRPSKPNDLPPGSPEAYQAELAEAGKRRLRPIPLVLGLILAIAGGIGAAMILRGPEQKYDDLVLSQWPAGWLVDDLNSEDPARRSDAFRELSRRNEEHSLSDSATDRLISRHIANLTNDTTSPEAPMRNAPVIEFDLVKARRENRLDAQRWTKYIARSAPLRLDVPRRVESGQPLQLRFDASLVDPTAPAWVIVQVEPLTIGGKPMELPAVAVAPNPQWTPPPPPEPVEQDADQLAIGGAGGPRPPVVRRVVRYPYPVPAEILEALGKGTHPVVGKIHVYAFDADVVPAPTELLSDAATGLPRRQQAEGELVAAVLSAQLTREQFEQFVAKAHAKHEWPVNRQVEVRDAGDPPATQPATQEAAHEPAHEPASQAAPQTADGEGAGDGR